MVSQRMSVSAADLETVIRDQQAEITNLRLVLASARRQLVEAQAALAAAKKGDDGAVEGGQKGQRSTPVEDREKHNG